MNYIRPGREDINPLQARFSHSLLSRKKRLTSTIAVAILNSLKRINRNIL